MQCGRRHIPLVTTTLDNPEFDRGGDPTDETLKTIAEWQPNFDLADPYGVLIEFCKGAWNTDYGALREVISDDDTLNPHRVLLEFVTGGWSANEAVIRAMLKNSMFVAMRWESSNRGGSYKFTVPKVPIEPLPK